MSERSFSWYSERVEYLESEVERLNKLVEWQIEEIRRLRRAVSDEIKEKQ